MSKLLGTAFVMTWSLFPLVFSATDVSVTDTSNNVSTLASPDQGFQEHGSFPEVDSSSPNIINSYENEASLDVNEPIVSTGQNPEQVIDEAESDFEESDDEQTSEDIIPPVECDDSCYIIEDPLIVAVLTGDFETVGYMINDLGISVNYTEEVIGLTPLAAAVFSGNAEMVSFLLTQDGIDINQVVNSIGGTPLHIAESANCHEIVCLLLAAQKSSQTT